MTPLPVIVSKRGESRVRSGHPWIFKSDVMRASGAAPGAVVRVLGPTGRPLGFAFFSAQSEITLRMIERGDTLSPTFLRDRLLAARAWRETIAPGVEALRIVHGEGDGLPSLVVDRYGDYLVIQTLSQATDARKAEIVAALVEIFHPRGILERNDPRVRAHEGLTSQVGVLHGEVPETVTVIENGVRFEADLRRGQKTGLFLDQRENHAMAREYARGRVFDGFTYNGGFGLSVAARTSSALAVDVSADAVARVQRNAALNGVSNVTAREANVFDLLHDLDGRGERFDTVIL
ncbi:MAG TPA: class I SAM-dependent rRNA methyltransferase, partial [Vicinamibacteria bacterium]|nr:class I SAM-dependent rRNA methyltransferase [Vicinamibacteria bacterium]